MTSTLSTTESNSTSTPTTNGSASSGVQDVQNIIPPPPPKDSRSRVREYVRKLQDDITSYLQKLDPQVVLVEEIWERESSPGGGRTRVFKDGNVVAKGGVNWSEIESNSLPPSILVKFPHLTGKSFYVTGTSVVIHAKSPFIPSIHCNYRYFECDNVWYSSFLYLTNYRWFGGGVDISPHCLLDLPTNSESFPPSIIKFHSLLKNSLNNETYKIFKVWCDEYFYIPHRNEMRGVGGIFFDYQNGTSSNLYKGHNPSGKAAEIASTIAKQDAFKYPSTWEDIFSMVQSCGNTFCDSWDIFASLKTPEPTEEQLRWQGIRRGRYTEFNLVYDRGTKFGLQSNGRTESILMSLPPVASWEYAHTPQNDEQKLLSTYYQPYIDWLA